MRSAPRPVPFPTHSYDPDPDRPAPERQGAALLNDDRTLALAAHLLAFAGLAVPFGHVLGPLVVYLVQRERSAFVADHAREALNFQIWTTAVGFVLLVALVVAVAATEGMGGEWAPAPVLLAGVGLVLLWLGSVAVGAARAIEGVPYRYPLTLRLLRPPAPAAADRPDDLDPLPAPPPAGPGLPPSPASPPPSARLPPLTAGPPPLPAPSAPPTSPPAAAGSDPDAAG